MRSSQRLEAQQGLDPERDGQVQARFGILEIDAADLADAIEPVAEGVGVDAQPRRRLLLLTGLEVGAQRGDEVSLARAVVLDEGPEVPAAVVDQALVADRGQKPGQAPLRHSDHLAPARLKRASDSITDVTSRSAPATPVGASVGPLKPTEMVKPGFHSAIACWIWSPSA